MHTDLFLQSCLFIVSCQAIKHELVKVITEGLSQNEVQSSGKSIRAMFPEGNESKAQTTKSNRNCTSPSIGVPM